MFTGIIQSIGRIHEYEARGADARMVIRGGGLDFSDVAIGDSIAVNGVCLTAVALTPDSFTVDVSAVLKPGGRIVILEVDVPASRMLRAGFDVYFRGVVPLLGSLVSDGEAYTYLARSLVYLPDEQRLGATLSGAGFTAITATCRRTTP